MRVVALGPGTGPPASTRLGRGMPRPRRSVGYARPGAQRSERERVGCGYSMLLSTVQCVCGAHEREVSRSTKARFGPIGLRCWRALRPQQRAMEEDDGAQMLAALQADDARLEEATTVTVEQEALAMAATRERAEEHGVEPKSHGEHGWAGSMRRKFERFLEKHGERLGYEAGVGPTVEHAKHFVDYCASGAGRVCFSPVGRVGMGDKYLLIFEGLRVVAKIDPAEHLGYTFHAIEAVFANEWCARTLGRVGEPTLARTHQVAKRSERCSERVGASAPRPLRARGSARSQAAPSSAPSALLCDPMSLAAFSCLLGAFSSLVAPRDDCARSHRLDCSLRSNRRTNQTSLRPPARPGRDAPRAHCVR